MFSEAFQGSLSPDSCASGVDSTALSVGMAVCAGCRGEGAAWVMY